MKTSSGAMAWAWKLPVKSGPKIVLLALAEHINPSGECYPGQKRLAGMCGLSDRVVRAHLATLEELGYIRRFERRRDDGSRASDQIALVCDLPEESAGGGAEDLAGGPPEDLAGDGLNNKGTRSTAEAVDELRNRRQNNPTEAEAIRRVFAYWQQRCSHPAAKLSAERQSKIRARLREGRTADEFKQAIDGAAVAPFIDERGKRHDDIELICRNAVKFESFVDRAAPTQNNGGGKYGHLVQHC
jgi:DNA-binding transcriptional ArsR family regulator